MNDSTGYYLHSTQLILEMAVVPLEGESLYVVLRTICKTEILCIANCYGLLRMTDIHEDASLICGRGGCEEKRARGAAFITLASFLAAAVVLSVVFPRSFSSIMRLHCR